ncbi:MAG: T9SS type A sorting domain-containing protein, partial [bacterium]
MLLFFSMCYYKQKFLHLKVFIFLILLNITLKNINAKDSVSLDYTIGNLDTVSTVEELKSAINKANVNGNMTILLENGEYEIASSSWYPYITANNIMFKSLSGIRDSVLVKGSGMEITSGTENVFHLVGNSIIIADITVGECGNHGICLEGDSALIHNVKIQNTYEQMIKGVDAGDGADFGIIEYCFFEYTACFGPHYYIGGIDIHEGNNWIVRDNEFYNIKSPDSGLAEHAIHFWNNSADIVIERNKIVNCDRGIGFGLGSSGCQGGIIRNNMVYTSEDVGIGLESSPGTQVFNNSVYTEYYPNSIEFRFLKTTGVQIYNNITNRSITSRNGGKADVQSNITNSDFSWFVNPFAGDLHLSSAISDIVDQGIALTEVRVDFDKDERPQGTAYDIGADEYVNPTKCSNENNTFSACRLFQNYPNPFNLSTEIEYQISFSGMVHLVVYDVLGKRIRTLIKEPKDKGTYSIRFKGTELPSGIYFLQLRTDNTVLPRKCLLMK